MAAAKNILLINQYFYPDMAATSQLLGDLAQYLGANGWKVVALAGRGNYAKAHSATRNISGNVWSGVSVRRVWSTDFRRTNSLGRLCDYFTFLVSAAIAVVLSPKPDVVVCLSTPPFVAVLGLIAQLKGSRLIYKVEDLYPEVAVALSTLNEGSFLTRCLSWLSRFLLRKADGIIALDKAMADRLLQAGARSVEVIPNWADGVVIVPDPQAGRRFRQGMEMEQKFIVVYSGNLGLAHRFDAVIDAARRCAVGHSNVLFLFVGSGPRWNEVKEFAVGLSSVRFMDYQPREKLNDLYNAADLHLVTMQDEVAGLLFPSKYPAALAAGKPVLLVGGIAAPFAQEILEKELGWVCPHEPSAIVRAIESAMANPEKLKSIGRNARQVFEARYSKTIAMQRWEHVLKSVLKAPVLDREKAIEVRSA